MGKGRRAGARDGAHRAFGEGMPIQRCTVNKRRNLLSHVPKVMHDALTKAETEMV